MKAQYVYNRLEEYFKPDECTDAVKKGIQYDNTDDIVKVYTSTFAAESVINEIIRRGEKNVMLFSHHPLPQRKAPDYGPSSIPEVLLRKMAERGISLFSYHIPLDRNGEYSPGNNLAKAMEIVPYGEFYFQDNVYMGVLCRSDLTTVKEVKERLETVIGHRARLYQYGASGLEEGRLAIMAGGASNADIYEYLSREGINTFITGVTNPLRAEWAGKIHQKAKQYGINLVGGTHCSTEKFACIAMTRFFNEIGLEAEFIGEEPDMYDI